uniref:Uncharacterized protein n=1 Tax=Anopheles albimanus TaxID=7167 RepID=A0A182FY91_ANOAL
TVLCFFFFLSLPSFAFRLVYTANASESRRQGCQAVIQRRDRQTSNPKRRTPTSSRGTFPFLRAFIHTRDRPLTHQTYIFSYKITGSMQLQKPQGTLHRRKSNASGQMLYYLLWFGWKCVGWVK